MGTSLHAAQLMFEVPASTVSVGDSLILHVRLDSQGASINAIDLGILYPSLLKVKSISKTNSAIQLWVKDPSYTGSAILLSGGSPGGISSQKALIATVVFEAVSVGDGSFGLTPSSAVLLNDGSGTNAPLSLSTSAVHVVPRPAGQKPKEVSGGGEIKTFGDDISRPRSFSITVSNDGRLFSGKHFVSFFTTDPDSGVAYYEIQEGNGSFKKAQSPYLLSDQELKTVLRVRAYDGAGNYQQETYPGLFKRMWWWISGMFGR